MSDVGLDELRTALARARDGQAAVESAFEAFAERDLARENAALTARLEEADERLRDACARADALRGGFDALTVNFEREMTMKRSLLVEMSERRAAEYYRAGLAREVERIEALRLDAQDKIDCLAGELRAVEDAERDALSAELADLSGKITERAQAARQRAQDAYAEAAKAHGDALDGMKNAPLGADALSVLRKFFDWEAFLGLKIISAVGMLLILFGVFTFGRYLYVRMEGAFQCASIFALGIALLVGGEILYRKWRGPFSVALTAGGAGVLFLGAALGYMTIGVLPMIPALAICAGASVVTFLLALRYDAQLVAAFALVGGYLPMFAIKSDIAVYAALYFMILDLLALSIATRKNWRAARFLGLFAGATAALSLPIYGGEAIYGVTIAAAYIAYLIIPVFGARWTKVAVRRSDVVLLTLNVVFRFMLALLWIRRDYWLAAAFFFVTCAVMAVVCEYGKAEILPRDEKGSLKALFFITSVTFAALVALYKLDKVWFSTGWLIEAAGLLTYGFIKSRRRFIVAGGVIGVSCLLAFALFDIPLYRDPRFVVQYGLITLALAAAAFASLKLRPKRGETRIGVEFFRGVSAANIWWFAIYVLREPVYNWLIDLAERHLADYLTILAAIAAGLLIGLILPRIRKTYGCGIHAAAVLTSVCAGAWLVWFNARSGGLAHFAGGSALGLTVFAAYAVVNVGCVAWANDFLRFVCRVGKLPLAWYPLLISGWAVFLAAQNMVVQMSLSASSLILTLLLALTALAWVLYGFAKRNLLTRLSGLAASFVCVVKLFLLDLYDLTSGWRIASYFTGGVILLAISFAYQYFNKKLKEEGAKKPD